MTALSLESHSSILDINEPHLFDESIQSMQYYQFTPATQQNNNTVGHAIKIDINAQDIYILPSKSYLSIKGQIRRADNNNAFAAGPDITLINNAMMYLFTEIKYDIGSTNIEKISTPGQVTSIFGYLSQPDDFNTSSGLKYCWSKDTVNHASSAEFAANVGAPAAGYTPARNGEYNQGFAARKGLLTSSNPLGHFSFIVPFTHIFGFGEYQKVIYGQKHTLTLTRGSDTQALYKANAVNDGKVDITHISWEMPELGLSPEYLAAMRSLIESKVTIPLAFRARSSEQITVSQTRNFTWRMSVTGGVEKPRWIVVAFQTDRSETQEQNPAVFDNLQLTNTYITLKSERYPSGDIITNYTTNDYAKLYDMFDDFKKNYYGIDSLVGGTQVNFPAFKTLFPIIVFDVRKQNERLKSGVVDIQAKFQFGANVPANTTAYAIMISDRFFKMASDGKNMTVVSM